MSEGWSAFEAVLYPALAAIAAFLVIAALVLILKGPRGRPGRSGADEPIWFGGPGLGERADGEANLILTGAPPEWGGRPVDWSHVLQSRPDGREARETGGASAGW